VELNKYIKEILLTRDNVIVQDFGGFEKSMVSASINEKTGEMTPPHTTIIFRPELKNDNGVLIKYIAEKENCSEEKALEDIKQQVEGWEKTFADGKNVVLVGLGMLHKDASGNIAFTPSIEPSDFPESFGLPVIQLQEKSANVQTPVNKNQEKEKPEKKQATQQKKQPVKKPVKKKETTESTGDKKISKKLIVGLAIGIPVVALIILGALNFDFVKQKFNDTSNFVSGLISGKDDGVDTTANNQVVNIDTLTKEDSTRIETEAILENYTIINAETNTKVEPKLDELSTVKKVHIIAGSYKTKSFAQRHRNKLNKKGFKAVVLPENKGLYRVSVGSFDNIESAVSNFDKIKSIDESVNVWILVNK